MIDFNLSMGFVVTLLHDRHVLVSQHFVQEGVSLRVLYFLLDGDLCILEVH